MAHIKSIVGGPLSSFQNAASCASSRERAQATDSGKGHTQGWRSPPGTRGISLRTDHLPMSATPLQHLACPT